MGSCSSSPQLTPLALTMYIFAGTYERFLFGFKVPPLQSAEVRCSPGLHLPRYHATDPSVHGSLLCQAPHHHSSCTLSFSLSVCNANLHLVPRLQSLCSLLMSVSLGPLPACCCLQASSPLQRELTFAAHKVCAPGGGCMPCLQHIGVGGWVGVYVVFAALTPPSRTLLLNPPGRTPPKPPRPHSS